MNGNPGYSTGTDAPANKPAVRKLADAFVKTLRYINSHSAEEIAAN